MPGETLHISSQTEDEEHSKAPPNLVINHFPNPYVRHGGEVYQRTRIVRIPRAFDTIPYSEETPQFSLFTPGKEPAAFTDAMDNTVYGSRDNYVFGTTSMTQLVPQWLAQLELQDIVSDINALLLKAYPPFSWTTGLRSLVDIFTFLFLTRVLRTLSVGISNTMEEVDSYIENINDKLSKRHQDLRMISLKDSGLLSLDFQIPLTKRSTGLDQIVPLTNSHLTAGKP